MNILAESVWHSMDASMNFIVVLLVGGGTTLLVAVIWGAIAIAGKLERLLEAQRAANGLLSGIAESAMKKTSNVQRSTSNVQVPEKKIKMPPVTKTPAAGTAATTGQTEEVYKI